MIGKTLAHYEIIEKIGAGGMGEVYRAADTKLEREVAIKVLPAAVSGNAERLARFEQEARAAGGLNHPNLVTVYELGTHDGLPYIVMELMEGETLRDKFAAPAGLPSAELPAGDGDVGRGSASSPSSSGAILPVRKILEYGIQIARGLAAAHDKGITHRDLKPENIFVTTGGHVKILDFGLAKLTGPEEGEETRTVLGRRETDPGTVLGTVGYMSPEQVRADEVDHRSDIFSLGVILYEMLSGRRAFQADSSVERMNAILREDPPPLAGEQSGVPLVIDRIVRRCLEKEREERFQSGHDVAYALDAAQDSSASIAALPAASPGSGKAGWILLGAAIGIVVAATAYFAARPSPSTAPISSGLGPEARMLPLTFEPGAEFQPALAPDGRSFAYVSPNDGDLDIFLQRVGGENAINLTADSPEGDFHPAFSPDGERIAFRSGRDDGGIFIMGATGESVRRLTDFGHNPAWSPDGTELVIASAAIFVPTGRNVISELWRVDVATGDTTRISDGDAVEPAWSPSGQWIAYWGLPTGTGKRVLYTIPAGGGDPTALTDDDYFNWSPTWSSDERHLYFSSNRGGTMDLWRLPMNPATGQAAGPPEPVTVSTEWSADLNVSRDGRRIVFTSGRSTNTVCRLPFDAATGKVSGPAETLLTTSRDVWYARPSPDGRWLALKAADPYEDLFVCASDGSGMRRLTSDPAKDRQSRWSPKPDEIVFFSDRTGRYEIWSIRRDGSGLRQISDLAGENIASPIPSPDGTRLLVYSTEKEHASGLVDLTGEIPVSEVEWLPRIDSSRVFVGVSWSPDGLHIAGAARPGGGLHIYSLEERSYEAVPDANQGRWLADGRTILFRSESKLMTVDLESREVNTAYEIPDGSPFSAWEIDQDNRWIYFMQSETESDIWMLALDEEASPR